MSILQPSRSQQSSAPGVYLQNLQATRLQRALARIDIAAFIGYAQKGPCDLPMRVSSMRQFLSIFGEPLTLGHLAAAVKGFFENGGAVCYIIRLTDSQGASAQTLIPSQDPASANTFTISAAFNISALALAQDTPNSLPDSAVLQQFAPGEVNQSLANKGTWGNNISVSILPKALLNTEVVALSEDASQSYHDSIVGLELASVVRLSQTLVSANAAVTHISHIVAIKSINVFAQSVEWETPLSSPSLGFDLEQPIKLETIEFDVAVEYENKQLEKFVSLSPNSEHSRSLYKTLKNASSLIQISLSNPSKDDWREASTWPARTQKQALQLGDDGLLQINGSHYLAALSLLNTVDEVGIVCAPDLVIPDLTPPQQPFIAALKSIDCASLAPPKQGQVSGIVTDGKVPLNGVLIIDLESGQQVTTASDGRFNLQGLDISLRSLQLTKAGFLVSEIQVLAQLATSAYTLSMSPLMQPKALSQAEILSVQKAMLNPSVIGPYKIALLDSPSAGSKVEQIREWRSQLGDSDIAALAYPWLQVTHPSAIGDENRLVPPCGHFAGLLAQTDHLTGPHRSCANIRMRYAKGLTQDLNDVHLSLFTPQGITAVEAKDGQGIRIYGARTLSSNPQWRYLPVRRLFHAIEKTLEIALQWTVFEANNTLLRQAVVQFAQSFLSRLWRQGALAGSTQDAAFIVKCDLDNNPQNIVDAGRLVVDIAIAPSVPFEYINIRLGKTLDALEVSDS